MKKKRYEKKKTLQKLVGLLPIFSLGTGSQYNHLYRDTEAGRLALPRGKAVSRYKLCIVDGAAVV